MLACRVAEGKLPVLEAIINIKEKICLKEVYIKHETQCFMRLSYDVENYTDLGCCHPVILLDQHNSSHHTQPHTIMNNE